MGLFSDSKNAARLAKLEADQAKLLKQNETILKSLAKLSGEDPEKSQEALKPEKKTAQEPPAPEVEEDPAPEEDPEEDPTPEEDPAPEEDPEPEPEPAQTKGKGKPSQAAPSNAAVMAELKKLRQQIAGEGQKKQASEVARIGITPLRTVGKPESAEVAQEGTHLDRTLKAWGKPLAKSS